MAERKLTRHEMREAALLILFQMQFNPATLDELLEDCKESFEMEYNAQSVSLAKGVNERCIPSQTTLCNLLKAHRESPD